MARHRHRRSSYRRKTSKRSNKNILNKTLEQSVSVAKSTSKKYMPKVKSGLETVGSKVVKSGQQSIPFLQQMTRKFFGIFSLKTRKNRRH
jgi:hypothetical protein